MKMKRCVQFIIILLLTTPVLFGDDFIHLKNGRVIGVTKYTIAEGWIQMELPGGGEIGIKEDQVVKIEKANIQLTEYKAREAVEYRDPGGGRRNMPPMDPNSNFTGRDVFAEGSQEWMDREERRRRAKERMEQFREMQSRGQPLDEQAREDLKNLEEEMRGESRSGPPRGGNPAKKDEDNREGD